MLPSVARGAPHTGNSNCDSFEINYLFFELDFVESNSAVVSRMGGGGGGLRGRGDTKFEEIEER